MTENSGDPMENIIREALKARGLRFVEGDGTPKSKNLDFYLLDYGIYIEVKQFHSNRIAEQMARAPNIIVAQGRDAVTYLAKLIRGG